MRRCRRVPQAPPPRQRGARSPSRVAAAASAGRPAGGRRQTPTASWPPSRPGVPRAFPDYLHIPLSEKPGTQPRSHGRGGFFSHTNPDPAAPTPNPQGGSRDPPVSLHTPRAPPHRHPGRYCTGAVTRHRGNENTPRRRPPSSGCMVVLQCGEYTLTHTPATARPQTTRPRSGPLHPPGGPPRTLPT